MTTGNTSGPEAPWRPLSVRQEGESEAANYDALQDGVPRWLMHSRLEWIKAELPQNARTAVGTQRVWSAASAAKMRDLERHTRVPLEWAVGRENARTVGDLLLTGFQHDQSSCLDAVDHLVHLYRIGDSAAQALEGMLEEAGSTWRVAEGLHGFCYLERRVDDSAISNARQAFDRGRAGDHLRDAWHSVYGRPPNPTVAYAEAVKAVEVAARPAISPNDSTATLGRMVEAIRDKPKKWVTRLVGRTVEGVVVVETMARLLWQGQHDRHGDAGAPRSVTQAEAEAAVQLAVLLVQWFELGAFAIARPILPDQDRFG
jgi:hypothetical protein